MKRSDPVAFAVVLLLLLNVLICSGCSHYVEPSPERTDAATLIGRGGAYISRVDGTEVQHKTINADNGNRVRVLGGLPHELTVNVVGTHPAVWNFKLDTDRGGTYTIEPQAGSNLGLTVIDQATGRAIPVK